LIYFDIPITLGYLILLRKMKGFEHGFGHKKYPDNKSHDVFVVISLTVFLSANFSGIVAALC